MIWHDMMWHDVSWHDMTYILTWHDMTWHKFNTRHSSILCRTLQPMWCTHTHTTHPANLHHVWSMMWCGAGDPCVGQISNLGTNTALNCNRSQSTYRVGHTGTPPPPLHRVTGQQRQQGGGVSTYEPKLKPNMRKNMETTRQKCL